MGTPRLSTRVDEDIWKKLTKRARLEGKDESEVVREALRAHLAQSEESAYDALRRVGGIGVVKGTAGDLSTNKKHFEGFGVSDRTSSAGHRSTRRTSRK
jgi:hypothetical protein